MASRIAANFRKNKATLSYLRRISSCFQSKCIRNRPLSIERQIKSLAVAFNRADSVFYGRNEHRQFHVSSSLGGEIRPFKLSDIGEGIAEVTIKEWYVEVGSKVSQFDSICEVQSDKASVTITSKFDGVIKKIYYGVDDIARVGLTLVDIEVATEEAEVDEDGERLLENDPTTEEVLPNVDKTLNTEAGFPAPESTAGAGKKGIATPAVRRLAMEHNVSIGFDFGTLECCDITLKLSDITGTGKDGRILKEDVLHFLSKPADAKREEPIAKAKVPTPPPTPVAAPKKEIIQPVVRTVTAEDKVEPLTGIRKAMVKAMNSAVHIPHFLYCDEVNADAVIRTRNLLKSECERYGVKLSFMPFFIKATSLALREHPVLNSSLTEDQSSLIYKASHNIGVAMDTADGLIVPNVKDVQHKSILDIAVELNRLHNLGLSNKLGPADITNGTISLSNIGAISGTYAKPVILPPEVAIAAIGKIQKLPRFDENGNVYAANIFNMSWSADHRVIEGAVMARFSDLPLVLTFLLIIIKRSDVVWSDPTLRVNLVSATDITATQSTVNTIYASAADASSKNATLQCKYNTSLYTDIQWYRGSTLLSDQSKYFINRLVNLSTMTIISVTAADIGNYTCNATNNQSFVVDQVSLSVVVYTSITQHPDSQTIIEGTAAVNFTCNADGTPSPSFSWMKNSSYRLQSDSKFTFLNYDKVLRINNINRNDAGNYSCVAENGQTAKSSTVTLSVQYIDAPTFNATNTVTLIENDKLAVRCLSVSLPGARFYWITDAGAIVSTTDLLLFDSINRNNSGSYRCNATNEAGTKISSPLNLTVQYIDIPTFNTTNTVTLIEKDKLAVKCSSVSLPGASINWINDAGAIVSTTDLLLIDSIHRNNAGSYRCNATNGAGTKTSSPLNLTVQYIDIPTFNRTNTVTFIEKDKLVVKCSSVSLPGARINWVTDAGAIVSTTDLLLFDSINRNNTGSYRCNATNEAGTKISSPLNLTVQYIDIPTFNRTNTVILIEKDKLVVKCSSVSLPGASINWINDAGAIVSTTDLLLFDSINRNNTGSYRCNATNEAGTKISSPLNLTVQYIDIPTFNRTNTVTLIEKDKLVVKCSSVSLPGASINWINDAGAIVSTTDLLLFDSINRNNTGSYRCNATNEAGTKISSPLNLTVQYIDIPTFNRTNTVTLIEKDKLVVKCSSVSLPGASINWINDAGAIVSTTDLLLFDSINRNNTGSYRCNATNEAGTKISSPLNLTVQYIDIPTFNRTNTVTLIEKDKLVVKCSSVSLPGASINWINDAGAIVSTTDLLLFDSINRKNTGSYRCNATNEAGTKISSPLNLTVQYIDIPTFNRTNTVTLIEKDKLVVKCSSVSLPGASINWINDAGATVSTTDLLLFDSINRNNTGSYRCNATNAAGSKTSNNLTIAVQYIDKPTLNTSNQVVIVEQQSLHIQCTAVSLPAANYIWATDRGVTISASNTLSFNSINRTDEGTYYCNATNLAGTKKSDPLSITVHFIDRPTFNVSSSQVTRVENSPLYVKCSSTLSPAASFQWLSSSGDVVSNTNMLVFASISRTDAGVYTCNATNVVGSQTASINVTVQYIDLPTLNVTYSNISITEASRFSVLCQSNALPDAGYQWISGQGETVSNSALLSFASIHRNNSGNYYCSVLNYAGNKVSRNITIDVQYIDTPELNSTLSSIVRIEKDPLSVRCQSTANPSADYQWISNTTGKIISSTSLLLYASIDRKDSGSYYCNASNSVAVKSSSFISIDVQYIDIPTLNDSTSVINEGTSLYVLCSATSSPPATYKWMLNSTTILSNTSHLRLQSVQRIDKGQYQCLASNPAGTQVSNPISLIVNYLDKPVITPTSPDFIAGSKESLSCSANGYPAPSFSWATSSTYRVNSAASGNQYTWDPISVAHAGQYTCAATNAFGTKEDTVTVKVEFSTLENNTISNIGSSITQTTASMILTKFSDIHGPIRYYQVIAKRLQNSSIPNTSSKQLVSLSGYSSSDKNKAYITAEFSSLMFANKTSLEFIIGAGQITSGNKTTTRFRRNSDATEFENVPLDLDSYYSAFFRGYVTDTVFISSPWLPPFRTLPKPGDTGLSGGAVAGIVIGVLLLFALVFFGVFLYKRRITRTDDKGGSEEIKITAQSTRRKRPSFLTRGLRKEISDPSTPIEIDRFEGHVNSLKANSGFGFSQEYSMISRELLHPHSHSLAAVNTLKNRYANIHPYDHSRVILTRTNQPGSDYINASFVCGHNSQQEYIAAQGPLPETIDDFWRMIWEQNARAIVMVTRVMENCRPKCAQYWPSQGSETWSDLVVSINEILEFPDHFVRTFNLAKSGHAEERTVKQFHFIGWPDHGVPVNASALFSLIKKVNRWRKACYNQNAPLIVHCSAGVGRTGTYIALDTQINRVANDMHINIFENVNDLRDRRFLMVQTEDQYAYLHHALLEYIKSGDTEIQANELRDYIKKKIEIDPLTGSTGLMDEFVSLARTDVQHTFMEANKNSNQQKNRYKNVYPYDETRVKLQSIPGVMSSDYINASYVDGYMQTKAFIATQAPLPTTISDFWRMIWERDSRTIVVLSNEIEASKVKVNKYWPEDSSVKTWVLIVELLSNTEYPEYILREFKLTHSEEGQSRIIRQFHYTAWPESGSPESAFGMIDMIGQVCKWNASADSRIVTVHCSAGVGRTGLFIALTNLIERLKTEAVVDVFQTVKQLRHQRTAMVQTREQYEFCYRALQEYLDSFDHYANFE
eukprot:gene8073-8937_t